MKKMKPPPKHDLIVEARERWGQQFKLRVATVERILSLGQVNDRPTPMATDDKKEELKEYEKISAELIRLKVDMIKVQARITRWQRELEDMEKVRDAFRVRLTAIYEDLKKIVG